jgi:hypothetical protein
MSEILQALLILAAAAALVVVFRVVHREQVSRRATGVPHSLLPREPEYPSFRPEVCRAHEPTVEGMDRILRGGTAPCVYCGTLLAAPEEERR